MRIERWLASLGLDQYVKAFVDNSINDEILPILTDADLLQLGVVALGHRKKLLAAIAGLSAHRSPPAPHDDLVRDLFLDMLPAVLAIPLHDHLRETHTIMRLHRLCDALEALTRFATLVGWMDLQEHLEGHMPEKLVASFAKSIARPTFGMWARMLAELAEASRGLPLVVAELPSWALDVLLPRLGTGEYLDRDVIALRNTLAHGGGITHEVGRGLLASHEPATLEVWRSAAFLRQIVVAQVRSRRLAVLRGPSDEPRDMEAPETLVSWLGRHEQRIVLIRDERALLLWPLLDYDHAMMPRAAGPHQAVEASTLVYLRAEPEYLVYSALWGELPLSQKVDTIEAFAKLFRLIEQRRVSGTSVVEDFTDEIRVDADHLVGRNEERAALRAVVKERNSGMLWITGPGGMGKTMLMASLARDQSNAPRKRQLVVAYRFKAGDSRCSRVGFLRLAVREISAWLADTLGVLPRSPTHPLGLQELEEQFTTLLLSVGRLEAGGERASRPPRLIVVLDGLDEIVRYDAEFTDLLSRHQQPNVLWVCAGRPEGTLPAYFAPERCQHIFPGGLPPMKLADVRAMLIEGSPGSKYALLRRDQESTDGTVCNDFVEAVTRNARGLPLYVRFVTEDINRGELGFGDVTRLPQGLSEYYEELLRRVGVSDLQGLLTPLIVLIAWAEGPLSAGALQALLSRWRLLEIGESGRTLLGEALTCVQGILRPLPTPSGSVGYLPYHDTFRTYVRESPTTRLTGARIREDLARMSVVWRDFEPGSDARAYLIRHGVSHLVGLDWVAEAVELLHQLRTHAEDRAGMDLATVQWMERSLLISLNTRNLVTARARAIDPDNLLDVVINVVEEFEVYIGALRLLYEQHRPQWAEMIERILASANWSPGYAASLVLAEGFLQNRDPDTMSSVLRFACDPRIPYHELGLYVLKVVASHEASTLDPVLLDPFFLGSGWVRRGILGELLVTLALRGTDVVNIIDRAGFWEPVWPYHRVQIDDAVAVQILVSGTARADAALRAGVAQSVKEIKATLDLRGALEQSREVAADERLVRLVSGYHELPLHLGSIRAAEPALRASRELLRLARLLFAHPSWEVRAAAGVVVGGLWAHRNELDVFIRQCLRDPDWRIRYAAMGASDAVRGADGGKLLEEALHLHAVDSHPWIRGLAADCLRDWIVGSGVDTSRLARFENELKALLCDDDIWPLVEAQMTVPRLKRARVDVQAYIEAAGRSRLGRIPGWTEMNASEIQAALDAAVST